MAPMHTAITIIAPRHPDRGPGILEIASAAGLKAMLRSRGELPGPNTDVYVADKHGLEAIPGLG